MNISIFILLHSQLNILYDLARNPLLHRVWFYDAAAGVDQVGGGRGAELLGAGVGREEEFDLLETKK